jgi:hypothetical protein
MVVLLQLVQSSQCHSTNFLALQEKTTVVKTQQSKQRQYANWISLHRYSDILINCSLVQNTNPSIPNYKTFWPF